MTVQVVLEPNDDGGFTALVPSLPGCISEGRTREEALKNLKEAVELYLGPEEDGVTVLRASRDLQNQGFGERLRCKSPLIFAGSVAGAFMVVALLPYAVVGETWGMIWYSVAAPFSGLLKNNLSRIEPYPFAYVLGTTIIAATWWTVITYAVVALVRRLTRAR